MSGNKTGESHPVSAERPHVGLIGLAVMGENLALNIARNGYPLVVYNRTTTRTDEYLAGPAAGTGIETDVRISPGSSAVK